uniref:Putative secreted protein n=1 Tax=Ixodes ricinus TaxID=34613 RepID=A0A6B0UJZ3_IXORI
MKTQSLYPAASSLLGVAGGAHGILRSTSGKSSKLDVSSMLFTSMGMAAGRSRMWSQSTPRKKGCARICGKPPWAPTRASASEQNPWTRQRASSEMGTSAGNTRVSRQPITLR